jgi:hypothetical protein
LMENWSTASTTAGTSANAWVFVNQMGMYGLTGLDHRLFGATASNSKSQYYPGEGVYSVQTAAPPSTVAFSEIGSIQSVITHYFNILCSEAS